MPQQTDLDRARDVARSLFKTILDYWQLCCELQRGMPADDPRLDDITRMRARVRDDLEQAEAELVPHLHEFACVHEWPVTVSGFTASSAHQATIQWAVWLSQQSWTTAGFRDYFKRYYDVEKGQVDWDAVRAADDRTDAGMYEFWARHDWSEHKALLEMEYAKGRKLASNPSADVPKLVNIESCVLEALGDEVMTGREIAEKSGYRYNSNLKARLAHMVEKRLLVKHQPHGYSRANAAIA